MYVNMENMDLLPPTAPCLVFARETYTPYSTCRRLHTYVTELVQETFPSMVESEKESVVKLVKTCLKKKDHMNILQLDSSDSAMEIEEIILQALLKG